MDANNKEVSYKKNFYVFMNEVSYKKETSVMNIYNNRNPTDNNRAQGNHTLIKVTRVTPHASLSKINTTYTW